MEKIIYSNHRMWQQGFETLFNNECSDGDIIQPFNKLVIKDGFCPTLTTRPEGFKTAILIVEKEDNNG